MLVVRLVNKSFFFHCHHQMEKGDASAQNVQKVIVFPTFAIKKVTNIVHVVKYVH